MRLSIILNRSTVTFSSHCFTGSNHYGIVAHYTLRAVEQGLIVRHHGYCCRLFSRWYDAFFPLSGDIRHQHLSLGSAYKSTASKDTSNCSCSLHASCHSFSSGVARPGPWPDPGLPRPGPGPWQCCNVPRQYRQLVEEYKRAGHSIVRVSSEAEQHEELPTYILFINSLRNSLSVS